jgi:hypothetical protein
MRHGTWDMGHGTKGKQSDGSFLSVFSLDALFPFFWDAVFEKLEFDITAVVC